MSSVRIVARDVPVFSIETTIRRVLKLWNDDWISFRTYIPADTDCWHHDAPEDSHLLLWCASVPTLIIDDKGAVYQPLNNDIVIFDNRAFQHRTPKEMIRESFRMFFRMTIPNRYVHPNLTHINQMEALIEIPYLSRLNRETPPTCY